MQYKTIILELIRSRPELHRRLKASKTLLSTVDRYAMLLKTSHEAWMEELRGTRPEPDSALIASEALEIALKVIEQAMPDGSAADEMERFPLDEMIAFVGQVKPQN